MHQQKHAAELGAFLKSRRARMSPADAGLAQYGERRRVTGLRREELALLAGVSIDYYVRIEQGRAGAVSEGVLDALARVLGLDGTERAHLYTLARPPHTEAAQGETDDVRPGVRHLLAAVTAPAFVLGRCMDVLAWNRAADALLGFSTQPPERRNMARHAFLDPARHTYYPDWAAVAADTVAYLRLDAARHPGDARLTALVDELGAHSPEFRTMWDEHQVREKTHGSKVLNLGEAGVFDVGYETLALPGDPDLLVVVYTTAPGSPAHAAIAAATAH